MGMFDFNPKDVTVATSEGYTNAPMLGAYSAYGGLFESVGKMMGFKDEEDLLQEIYESSDFTTPEGREKALQRIRAISPAKAAELQKQILEAAQTEANIVQTELATENAQVEAMKKRKASIYMKDFQRDASNEGLALNIQYYLQRHNFKFDADNPPTTLAKAREIIAKARKKQKDAKSFQNDLDTWISTQQDLYVNKRAAQDAGVIQTPTAETEAFDTPVVTSTSTETEGNDTPAPKDETPEGFNPVTSPAGPDFKGMHNGKMGTWKYKYTVSAGGQGGSGGWKHTPDQVEEQYQGSTITVDGQQITSGNMESYFNNFM